MPSLRPKQSKGVRKRPNIFQSQQKEIIKIIEEINRPKKVTYPTLENRKTRVVLWKDKQNYKPLARLIKKKRERTQMNTIRYEGGEITTSFTEIQKIVRECYR